ncbi:hypothetical protein [Polaribacter sp.]|uniref:hypothetical protein n=1 Tax=Polaribacter sp. TaxID=1920175 RepID=UPI003F6A6F42
MDNKEEKARIINYFRKIMEEVAQEVLEDKIVTRSNLYLLLEAKGVEKEILAKPKNIKYKYSKKHLPKVRIKSEFKSLKNNMRIGLIGVFSIRKKNTSHKSKKLVSKNFYVEEYQLN